MDAARIPHQPGPPGTSARTRKRLLFTGAALVALLLVVGGVVLATRDSEAGEGVNPVVDPVVVVLPTGQAFRAGEVAEHLDEISMAHFKLERDPGMPQSRERKKLCGHIAGWMVDENRPLQVPMEAREPLRFPEGPKAFLDPCLAADQR